MERTTEVLVLVLLDLFECQDGFVFSILAVIQFGNVMRVHVVATITNPEVSKMIL